MWLFRKIYLDYSKEEGFHIVYRKYNLNDFKQFLLLIAASLLFMGGIFFALYVVALIIPSNKRIDDRTRSNKELILEFQAQYITDYEFLNRAAQLFAETNYPDDLSYDFHGTPGSRHQLFHNGKNVSEVFPKIQEYMKQQYPDADYCPYGIWYSKYIVYIEWHKLYNETNHCVVLIYSNNKNNIINQFSSFKFYEYDIPEGKDSWLYALDKNWYICSPNTHLWNDFCTE